MKGNGFVPPKVATPQQYFMMNNPSMETTTNQIKPNNSIKSNSTSAVNLTKGSNTTPKQEILTHTFSKPSVYAIHQPSLDRVKNFMQPLNKVIQEKQKTFKIELKPSPFNEITSTQKFSQPISTASSPFTHPPKPLLRNGSMNQSAVTEGGSKKITFTQNLQQQFPVQSWKKQNMQNTFGYLPPPTPIPEKQEEIQNSEGGQQTQIQGKDLNKKRSQPCCLLF